MYGRADGGRLAQTLRTKHQTKAAYSLVVLEAIQVLAGLAANDGAAERLVCDLHQGGRHGGRAGAAPVGRRELLGQLAVVQRVSGPKACRKLLKGSRMRKSLV